MTALHERLLELKSRLGLKYEEDERTMDEAATALQSSGGEVGFDDGLAGHAGEICGWVCGLAYQPASANDDATDRMNRGWEPVTKVPPSTAFALPTASPAQPSDAKDAARYRWLRDRAAKLAIYSDIPADVLINGDWQDMPGMLDETIDAALTAAPAPIEQEG